MEMSRFLFAVQYGQATAERAENKRSPFQLQTGIFFAVRITAKGRGHRHYRPTGPGRVAGSRDQRRWHRAARRHGVRRFSSRKQGNSNRAGDGISTISIIPPDRRNTVKSYRLRAK